LYKPKSKEREREFADIKSVATGVLLQL